MMSALRQKMIEDMSLRGLSANTQRAYIQAVSRLAQHYNKSPDEISDADLRDYFLYLTNEKGLSRSSCTVVLCAVKFLYVYTLQRSWPMQDLVRPKREKKQPVIFSRAEVKQLLGVVRKAHYRVCLLTIYSCGLRISEGTNLQVQQIDSARMQLHIQSGKGNKDRRVRLPDVTLQHLRQFWLTHRNPQWIFPSRSTGGQAIAHAPRPMCTARVWHAFKVALAESGIGKAATVHTLRHSWATHLLEAGVHIRQIQAWMGHFSLNTTMRYTHLTQDAQNTAQAQLNALVANLL